MLSQSNAWTGKLVGDAGFEPATSTMSTWRSTPELIALITNFFVENRAFVRTNLMVRCQRTTGQVRFATPELIALITNFFVENRAFVRTNLMVGASVPFCYP